MIRSILDCASILWSPYTQKNTQALESVQRRSARFVLDNYSLYDSISDMFTNFHWSPLADEQKEQSLPMLHHLVDIDVFNLISVLLQGLSMKISSAIHRFSAHCSKRFAEVGVKSNTFLFMKIDCIIVTQVGFCVISPWSLSRFLSNHQKALLRWLLHLQSYFQLIP